MKREDWIKVEDRLPENDDIVLIRCVGIWGGFSRRPVLCGQLYRTIEEMGR